MKKRIVYALSTSAVSVLMVAAPAFGHDAGPCNDSGEPGHSDFAKHHVVPAVGQESDHNPGEHRGFSACDPSGR
jgi:hypothetical protein